jgi:hypothetical protein
MEEKMCVTIITREEIAAARKREHIGVWLDAMAHETVERLQEYAGVDVDWLSLRNAMQREVTRQLEARGKP